MSVAWSTTSRDRALKLLWCETCERWFHRPVHDCADWQRPVNWQTLNDGLAD